MIMSVGIIRALALMSSVLANLLLLALAGSNSEDVTEVLSPSSNFIVPPPSSLPITIPITLNEDIVTLVYDDGSVGAGLCVGP